MKYPAIFVIMAVTATSYAMEAVLPMAIALYYLSLNLAFLAFTYAMNEPTLLGKSHTGKLTPKFWITNFIWGGFSHLVWAIQVFFSKENPYDKVKNTQIIIGRRLYCHEFPSDIEMVIDLTSEFSENLPDGLEYLNFPLLDGIAPKVDISLRVEELAKEIDGKVVYIHCAQGHGRTALFTSVLLSKIWIEMSPIDCYQQILKDRPLAHCSGIQKKYLSELANQ